MDQLSAHMDRGWELVERGDAAGAYLSAQKAVELEPQAPEAHHLLGHVCGIRGEAEAALTHYQRAIELDEDFVEAMLSAAEVLIEGLERPEDALSLLGEALELCSSEEERTDALLLQVDALLALGRTEQAHQSLERMPKASQDKPQLAFLLGRACFDTGRLEAAEAHLQRCLAKADNHADANYFLGLIHESKHQERQATACFLRTRFLDAQQKAPSWSLNKTEFETRVHRILTELPDRVSRYLDGALVLCEVAPGVEAIADGADPRATVLLDQARLSHKQPANVGEAPQKSSSMGNKSPIAHLFVYQRNLERCLSGPEGLNALLRKSIVEELQNLYAEET